jgi:hypothetical protein
MNNKIFRYGETAALFVILTIIFIFSWVTVDVSFPALEHVSDKMERNLVPIEPYNDIAPLVSRFFWEYRGMDITFQAFVIVTAVICCIAMLKIDEEIK